MSAQASPPAALLLVALASLFAWPDDKAVDLAHVLEGPVAARI